MKCFFKGLLVFTFILNSYSLSAKELIKVGAYDWPPYMEWKSGIASGLLLDYVELLNKNQNHYTFKIVETSPNRRYEDLYKQHYDVIFFESVAWGWDKNLVYSSEQFLKGGEFFIAKKISGRTQSYFNDLKNKTIKAFLGYHYAFLNFSTDPQVLKKWNVELSNSHDGNIQAVLEGRADLAIVTYEYLHLLLKKNPALKKDIIVAKKMDQIYNHSAIALHNGKINKTDLSALLKKITKDASFKKIFKSIPDQQ